MCVASRVCPGCPCGCLPLPVCVVADEMRRTDGGGWALSCAVVACLPYCFAPLFDKGDGEGGGTNDSGRLGDARLMVGEGDLLAADVAAGGRAFGRMR